MQHLSDKRDMEKKLEGMYEMALDSFFHFLEIIKEMEVDREEDELNEKILGLLNNTEKQLKALYSERRTCRGGY